MANRTRIHQMVQRFVVVVVFSFECYTMYALFVVVFVMFLDANFPGNVMENTKPDKQRSKRTMRQMNKRRRKKTIVNRSACDIIKGSTK